MHAGAFVRDNRFFFFSRGCEPYIYIFFFSFLRDMCVYVNYMCADRVREVYDAGCINAFFFLVQFVQHIQ